MLARTEGTLARPALGWTTPVNRLFREFLGEMPFARQVRGSYPAVNLWDDGEAFMVEAEMPGVKLEDLHISVLGDQLEIKGERKASGENGNPGQARIERYFGTFHRVLRMPAELDASKAEAKLKNGVLTLRLPKAESAKPSKIQIKAE
jgi:HSP20 family protein